MIYTAFKEASLIFAAVSVIIISFVLMTTGQGLVGFALLSTIVIVVDLKVKSLEQPHD